MPFQKGNKLGKGRPPDQISWRSTLTKAIKQDNAQRVRNAAEKLLDLAASGEAWAIKELAERLDGKSSQSMVIEGGREPIKFELTDTSALESEVRRLVSGVIPGVVEDREGTGRGSDTSKE
jgi:hypothetical protein